MSEFTLYGQQLINCTGDPSTIRQIISEQPNKKLKWQMAQSLGFTPAEVHGMLFDVMRDEIMPKFMSYLQASIVPWQNLNDNLSSSDDEILLPKIPLQTIWKETGISISTLRRCVKENEILINVGESTYQLGIETPEVSPKRIINEITYESRRPGGGPIVRSRTQWNRFSSVRNRLNKEKEQVVFSLVREESKNANDNEVIELDIFMEEYGVPVEKKQDLNTIINWLEKRGGRGWLTGNEKLLWERLADIAKGEKVDFNIWNCLGFNSVVQEEMPGAGTATINSNMENSIVKYFSEEIAETMQQISRLGDPNFIILIPTNEGLADNLGIWNYEQNRDLRDNIMNETFEKLKLIANEIFTIAGLPIQVCRWDDYLENACVEADQDQITTQGIQLSMDIAEVNPIYLQRVMEQASSFSGRALDSIADVDIVTEAQLRFKGIYLGEGIISSGNRIGDRKMIWLNFEGAGVKEDVALGAEGNIAILTPIGQGKILEYYMQKSRS